MTSKYQINRPMSQNFDWRNNHQQPVDSPAYIETPNDNYQKIIMSRYDFESIKSI